MKTGLKYLLYGLASVLALAWVVFIIATGTAPQVRAFIVVNMGFIVLGCITGWLACAALDALRKKRTRKVVAGLLCMVLPLLLSVGFALLFINAADDNNPLLIVGGSVLLFGPSLLFSYGFGSQYPEMPEAIFNSW